MLTKIDNEEREKLVNTMRDLVDIIDEIEDMAVKQRLCENLIGMCDQLKSRLYIRMIRDNNV